jgi:hypothetical protein
MPERTVTAVGFRYEDTDGYIKLAQRGETINLSDEEAARGDRLGAFAVESLPEAKRPVDATDDVVVIGPDSTDEELEAFVKDAKVGDVVDAAGQDGAFAQRLLEAENAATGNDPRKGVADGLAAVVGEA